LPSQARELLLRQLNDNPKPIYKKWDLLERKERLQLEKCSGAQVKAGVFKDVLPLG
jgi:hypothetical protein